MKQEQQMQTFRMWVPNRQGRCDLHFNDPQIKLTSVVLITVSEATPLGVVELLANPQTFKSNLGLAPVTLQNVSVRQGGVDFRVAVEWDHPLNLYADITLVADSAAVVIGR
jgi:hypothetical protein